MTNPFDQYGPDYNVAGTALAKHRQLAKDGLAALSYDERRTYGEAVERTILSLQRSELQRSFGPIKPRVRCASGTDYSDGADIHDAVRQQQLSALLAWPGKVRRNRTDVEWQQMYEAAMDAKAAAIAASLLAGGGMFAEAA